MADLGSFLRVLGGLGVVVGLVTGVGTIVSWIDAGSIDRDTAFAAFYLAGVVFLVGSLMAGVVFALPRFTAEFPLWLRLFFPVLVAGLIIINGYIFLAGGADEYEWLFFLFGCLAVGLGIWVLIDWTLEQRKHYKDARRVCPDCAETIKRKARVCRFCGYRFHAASQVQRPAPAPSPRRTALR